MAPSSDPGPIAKAFGVIVLIASVIFGFHFFTGAVKTVTASDKTSTKVKIQPDAYIGDSVRDGKFSFKVRSVDCGVKTISDSISTETALGKFCIVRLSILNIGKVANIIETSSQRLLDSTGKNYEPQSSAGETLPGNDSFDGLNLNPGLSANGAIVFDVPKSVTPIAIELHDGMFSTGQQVSLKGKK